APLAEHGALAYLPTRGIPGRTGDDLPGFGFANLAICVAPLSGSHAAALAADDGRAGAALARRAADSDAPRRWAFDPRVLADAALQFTAVARGICVAYASGDRPADLRSRDLALACAATLPTGP